jgi:alpha-L-rhamnosidase
VASWIEPIETTDGPEVARPAHHLAGEFTLDGPVGAAVLHITCHGIYEAFCNGTRVGDLELTPGFTAYRSRLQVHSFDVTDLVRPGANALGALLSDGWWRGQHGIVRATDAYGTTTALLAEVHVTTGDASVVACATDAGWRCTPSHILAADLMAGEVHDHRRRVAGWAEAGTDRAGWQPVRVADGGTAGLVAPVGPPTRRIEELAAVAVTELAPGRHLVDFGQNSNGWVRLSDLGPAGTELTVTYGEWLGPDGDLTQDNIAPSPLAVRRAEPVGFQVDRVVSAGDGSVFEPRHSTKGFRYVRVDGHPGPLDPASATSVVVHTDLVPVGGFACSDGRINALHRAAVWSFRGNACEIPTDCPTRERSGWVGDWQLYVATAAELYDVADWSARWLADLAADQWADGRVTSIVPDPSPHMPVWSGTHGSAGWGDAAVHVPWELYRATGRTDIAAEQFASMCAWVDFAAGAAADGRHLSRVERSAQPEAHERYLWDTGWHFGEWLEPDTVMEEVFTDLVTADHGPVATAYLYRSAAQLAELAGLLGEDDAARRYGALAADVLAAWRTEFIDDAGRVRPATQANLVRAVAFGLVPDGLVGQAAADLVERIRAAGTHLGTGFLSTPFLLPVLADTGHLEVAYELLFCDTEPSWLCMLARGATTVWEDWDGVRADGTAAHSLNHYSKGAVISFLRRYVAGLQIVEPGYRRFRVAPRPGGGITWARTHHDAPHGRIEVVWELDAGVGSIEVAVPEGTTAELRLPDRTGEELDAGRHRRRWGG